MTIKTNIAITLSFEGIGLLHRAETGWVFIDEISLDNSDLGAALSELSKKAHALEPEGIFSKLVIPNDQIKYISLDKRGLEADEIADTVRTTLEMATPYAVEDLAYDWTISGDTVYVAAVARQTLSEAETFAAQHNFNPVCVVAMPEQGAFDGEPWFGETQFAREQLEDGEHVERDLGPIHLIDAQSGEVPEETEEAEEIAPAAETLERLTSEETLEAEQEPEPETETAPEPAVEEALDSEKAATPISVFASSRGDDQSGLSFRSIRAERDTTPDTEPRLEGVTRDVEVAPLPDFAEAEATADFQNLAEHVYDAEIENEDTDEEETVDAPVIAAQSEASDEQFRSAPPIVPMRLKQEFGSVSFDDNEAERMTVFGARGAQVGGKPRFLGLILTTALLIFLLGVAAWASIFLKDDVTRFFTSDPAIDLEVASLPGVPQFSSEFESEEQADEAFIEEAPDVSLEEEEEVAALPSAEIAKPAEADTQISEDAPEPVTVEDVRNRYAVTGIWQIAPEAPANLSEPQVSDVYLTSIDPEVVKQDVVALQPIDGLSQDQRLATPLNPTAPSTKFDLDERGLVRATAEGAESPEGIKVYAGKPRLLPPSRPAETLDPISEASEIETAIALAKLGAVRPNGRPDDLVERQERSTLGGRTREELAKLSPKLRPQSAQQIALQAASDTPVTAQAVEVSLAPQQRPSDFDKIVQQSQQRKQRAQTQVAAATAPRVQTTSPRIPTATTVASAATQQNAISLRKVNLIGVYGSPSNRRALVRMANGRYKKVEVGDRLDGGRVTAIGDAELRYNKSGRSVALKMPRS